MEIKLYTSIPKSLEPFFKAELDKYREEYAKGNLEGAWGRLERAHIIGQQYPFAHMFVHWKMLQFSTKIKNAKEVIDQIPRLLFGGVKLFVGTIPMGNTGGANVLPFKPFPISKERQDIFGKTGIRSV